METQSKTLLYVVTEDWYFWSHRLPIARAARDAGWTVHVVTRVAKHRELIEAEGFHLTEIAFNRSGLNPLEDLGTLKALVAIYRRIRPQLVHHIAAKPVLYGTLAAFLCGVPAVVNTMAGMGFLFSNDRLKTRAARGLFMRLLLTLGNRRNTRLIVQNADDRQMFVDAGLNPARIVLIRGSGVDLQAYAASEEPDTTPVALCVSRLLRDKGIYELVDAARLLKQREVPLVVRLVGGTDLNPSSASEAEIEQWSREGIVEIAGHSDRVAEEHARAHIAVLPSYREGLPKSLLEAAAAGRPLVATDVPGCREICIPGETGLLVPVRDAAALADALEKLARDKALRRSLGKQARFLAETRFSNAIVVRDTLDVYQALSANEPG